MIKAIHNEKELRDVHQIRLHKRYTVDIREMTGKIILAKYVKILNISMGGIAFQTDRRLTIGGRYTLTIEGKGRDLMVQGIVAWSSLSECVKDSQDNVIPIYTAGMEFMDVANDKFNEMISIIEGPNRVSNKEADLFDQGLLQKTILQTS